MTAYYNAPYLEESEHAVLNHTGIPGVGGGGAAVTDKLAVAFDTLPTLTAGVPQTLNWASPDTVGTALSIDGVDSTIIHGSAGLYSLILQLVSGDPTVTGLLMSISVTTGGQWLLPDYTGPFGVGVCPVDNSFLFSGILIEVNSNFTFTIGVRSFGNAAPAAMTAQNMDIRKLQ